MKLAVDLPVQDAAIILPDADLDLAAKHIVKGAFSYAGQRCTAVKLVLAHESVADDLLARVLAGVKKLTVGRRALHILWVADKGISEV